MQIDHRMPRDFPRELEPMLKEFFGGELPRMEIPGPQGRGQGRGYQEEGTGSGVIIDSSGIILTNHHVVGGADHVIVTLQDGREFTATDIRTDHSTDVAILRIEGAGELPAATLGDSDALQIGDWVLAVGSPFGLDQTVTAGIVSALSRGMGIAEREDFIQTDAAINPGNSGGPLVNLRGEVVGINTAISTRGGGSDGIGFAVPINLATWITDQLVDDGIVHRAFLGVGIQQLNSELVDQLNLESMQGALVTEVRPGTAAEDAGLELGDVIVRFDDHVVRDPRDLQNVVERSAIDAGHELTVIRDGNEMMLYRHSSRDAGRGLRRDQRHATGSFGVRLTGHRSFEPDGRHGERARHVGCDGRRHHRCSAWQRGGEGGIEAGHGDQPRWSSTSEQRQ